MTMQRDRVSELFGLAGTFPRPGWVVLDAARDHRFTGELLVETAPPVRVYFDRGVIYLAERLTDPSLGARLVDAGALTAAQLERGAVRIGDVEHLGRLFERVPTLDRHTVMVTAELMTEECVRWLATQRVSDVVSTPYRHHESAVQQWSRVPGGTDLSPGDPLPAPPLDESPVSVAPPDHPEPTPELRTEPFLDGLIEWQEPSWFDSARLEQELVEPSLDDLTARVDESTTAASTPSLPSEPVPDDWVDRLATEGLPEQDPLAPPKPLPQLPVEPVGRFELVWPSGEIDEEFGTVDSVAGEGHDPDADRVGATARLARPGPAPEAPVPTETPATPDDGWHDEGEPTDEIVLAVRRAVASIEVGSLAARQRLADSRPLRSGPPAFPDQADAAGVPEPGRVAVRAGRNDWSRRTVTRSVFDEPVVEPEVVEPEPAPVAEDHRERRAGALRRLISSLRR